MNPPDIRKQLWNSLDLYCVRHDMTLVLIVVPLALLVCGLFGGLQGTDFWMVALIVCTIVVLPLMVFLLWITVRLFRHSDSYILCRAKLTQPHSIAWGRGMMYFTVALEHPQGGTFIVNTRPIFQTRSWLHPQLEDYLSKTVTIAYNEETEAVVVIS